MKILLIQNGSIVQAISNTPAIEALRKAYPRDKIDILVNDGNYCVMKNNPFINTIYDFKRVEQNKFLSHTSGFISRFSAKSKIWNHIYDVCVIFSDKFYKRDEGFAKMCGAKMIIGVDNNVADSCITHKIKLSGKNDVMNYFELLSPLNVSYGGEKMLFIPEKIESKFKNYVFVHCDTDSPHNVIGYDKLDRIIGFLQTKFSVVITSLNPSHSVYSDRVGVPFLCIKNYEELASHLTHAKFAVVPFGVVAHLAPTLGVKTLGIFGEKNQRFTSEFFNNKCIVLSNDIVRNIPDATINQTLMNDFFKI